MLFRTDSGHARSISIFVLIFTNGILSLCSNAETNPSFQIRSWTYADGLKESFINEIAISKSNIIYAVHKNLPYISIFDGFTIKSIPCPDDLWGLKVQDGEKLLALNIDGFHQFDGKQWTLHPLELYFNENTAFYPIEDDQVIVINRNRIFTYSLLNNEFELIIKIEDTNLDSFNSSAQSPTGEIWITGLDRIFQFNPKYPDVNKAECWKEFNNPLTQFSHFTSPCFNKNGRVVFVAQDTALNRYAIIEITDKKWEVLYQSSNRIKSVWPYGHDELLAHIGSKLWHICEHQIYEIEKTGPLTSTIRDIEIADNSDLWIAASKGLVNISRSIWIHPDYYSSEFSKSIDSIVNGEDGRVYLKCSNALIIYDGEEWNKHDYIEDEPEDRHSSSLSLIDNNVVIYGCNDIGQLLAFNTGTKEFYKINHPNGHFIDGIFNQSGNSLIITSLTKFNIRLIEKYTKHNIHNIIQFKNGLPIGIINTIVEDKEGTIWIGGSQGLVKIHAGNQADFYSFPEWQGISIHHLSLQPNGSLLISSTIGLYEYNKNEFIKIYDYFDPVSDILVEHDGRIWIGTENGVWLFTGNTWISYTINEGLPSNIVTSLYKDFNNVIWASTTLGPVKFQPGNDENTPETYIPSNENIAEFSSAGNAFFHFSGIDGWNKTLPSRLMYSTRINDGEWSEFMPSATAIFKNLQPGSHTLHVRAMDRSLLIDPTPASFSFTVIEPWYKNQFVYFIVTLSSVLLLIAIMQRIDYSKKRERMLKELLESQSQVKQLEGIIPICSCCKKIRDSNEVWHQLEKYIHEHSDANFSHGMCPECAEKFKNEL